MRRARSRAQGAPLSSLEVLQHAFADHKGGLAEGDVDTLVRQLLEHKHALQQQQREASMELLLHFLLSSRCGALAAVSYGMRACRAGGRACQVRASSAVDQHRGIIAPTLHAAERTR